MENVKVLIWSEGLLYRNAAHKKQAVKLSPVQHIHQPIEPLLQKMFVRLIVFRWLLIRASSPPSIFFLPSFMTSGLEPCSPPSSAPAPAPFLHSLFCMILIDSFMDCKEIGCSYNTAGLVGVMKKGITALRSQHQC